MAKENPNTELNKHRESRVSGSALLKALLMEWKPASFRKLSIPVQVGGRADNLSNLETPLRSRKPGLPQTTALYLNIGASPLFVKGKF